MGLLANSSLYGVDAFFLIAGFFAVLLFMKELEKVSQSVSQSVSPSVSQPVSQSAAQNKLSIFFGVRSHESIDRLIHSTPSTHPPTQQRFARTHGLGRRTALVGQMAIYTWVRRYLRLTPAFAVVLAVFTTLAGYLESSAPSPTGLGHQVALCREKWWQNILYVNNILR